MSVGRGVVVVAAIVIVWRICRRAKGEEGDLREMVLV